MTYDRYDLLRAWAEHREKQGIELEDMTSHDPIRYGGLDLAERIDSAVLYGALWDGIHLDEEGLSSWQRMKTPIIARNVREVNIKRPFQKITFDETGAGIVASSFFYDLPMEPVQLTQNRKDDAIHCVKYLFGEKILRVQNRQLITEMLEQEAVRGKGTGRVRYRHQDGRHDDAFWGCTLMCYGAVPDIVGIAPVAIEATQDVNGEDIDSMIRDVMKPYANSAYGQASW